MRANEGDEDSQREELVEGVGGGRYGARAGGVAIVVVVAIGMEERVPAGGADGVRAVLAHQHRRGRHLGVTGTCDKMKMLHISVPGGQITNISQKLRRSEKTI